MATHPLFRKTGWLCSLALLTALEAAAAPKTKPAASPAAPTGQTLEIVYLTQEHEAPPALSNLDPVVTDKGLQGARLAIVDNNTTGQFTKQHFTLKEVRVPQDATWRALTNKRPATARTTSSSTCRRRNC